MISAHTFRYDGNMIVLGNKSKTSISPTVAFNSVIELNAQQRIVKHTVEDPFTKQLNVTYSASYEGDQVTEKQVEGRTAEYDYDEQGELTNVSTISGLGWLMPS
jgi:YD repeat-containing protein